MALMRKIILDKKEFEWKFTFDDYDLLEASHLILRSNDKKLKIMIYFRSNGYESGYCPLNFGLQARKDNKDVTINLNEPHFVSEIYRYIIDNKIKTSTQGQYNFDDGLQILRELGYQFEYHLLKKKPEGIKPNP